ncbi:GTP-binding protein [Priestia megaterium]|uniref:CobW family GTP-binding protein n=1 Tax=Priestia megaterium TaxID=1404 RepID=UPI001151A368
MNEYNGKKPVTIVTGCLGSGKTTIIQKILLNKGYTEDFAVIVNEFGQVGLDHHLIRRAEERTVLLNGGCICCNSREDLEEELKTLLYADESGKETFDRVIIETTGLADPAPILFTIMSNPLLQNRYVIDCVITTIDAKNGKIHLKNNPEIYKQLSVADKVIVTKVDIASETEISELVTSVKGINPVCEIIYSIDGNVDPNVVKLNKSSIGISSINVNDISNRNHYSNDIQSISFTFSKPLNWVAFGLWLSMLLHAEGESILRVKGLLDVGEEGPIVLNGVQHIIHPPQHLDSWPEGENVSHIIFILREINTDKLSDSLFAFQKFLDTELSFLEHLKI